MKKGVSKEKIYKQLTNVLDPELGISIVDLGLIYDASYKNGTVEVLMTLTTIGCPLFGTIEEMVVQEVKKLEGVAKVTINLTFDPPWNTDMMSKQAQESMGFL